MATFPTITLNGNTTTTWINQGGGITTAPASAQAGKP